VEFAFLGLAEELIFPESSEYFRNMGLMIGGVGGIDEYVVQVNHNKNVEEVGEYIVHESLKGSGSIGETERHDEGFVGSIPSPEGSFPHVFGGDTDEIVARAKIQLGEHFG
jgi:hypothetical protein